MESRMNQSRSIENQSSSGFELRCAVGCAAPVGCAARNGRESQPLARDLRRPQNSLVTLSLFLTDWQLSLFFVSTPLCSKPTENHQIITVVVIVKMDTEYQNPDVTKEEYVQHERPARQGHACW